MVLNVQLPTRRFRQWPQHFVKVLKLLSLLPKVRAVVCGPLHLGRGHLTNDEPARSRECH